MVTIIVETYLYSCIKAQVHMLKVINLNIFSINNFPYNQLKLHIRENQDSDFFPDQLQNIIERGALDSRGSKCERIFQKYPFPSCRFKL